MLARHKNSYTQASKHGGDGGVSSLCNGGEIGGRVDADAGAVVVLVVVEDVGGIATVVDSAVAELAARVVVDGLSDRYTQEHSSVQARG